MEFQEALKALLAKNNGSATLQQVTDLLPDSGKHLVMSQLNAARNAGVCVYRAKVVDGKGTVIIRAPQASTASPVAKATPTTPGLVGGSQ